MRHVAFTVREAAADDYEGLCEIFAQVDSLHRRVVPSVFREPDGPARPRDHILGILADEDAAVFVAESGGQVVGLAVVLLREAPDIPILVPRRYAQVETLAVLESYRRQGVGSALMDRAHRWARDRGVGEVQLSVWEFNEEAMAFYGSLGYQTFLRRMWHRLV